MFEPGHLHLKQLPGLPGRHAYTLDIYYGIRHDASEGDMLTIRIVGEVDGKGFEEAFELHRDSAFDFASAATHRVARHGLTAATGLVMKNHAEYDLMFRDIRERLHIEPGEPINFDHAVRDGL